jgi:hypothetical protein
LVLSVAAVVGAVASGTALADVTKDQCVGANAKAQDLRREGKLSAAREQLLMCAAQSCPEIVRDDCTKRLDDLERAQPTVAFEVKDAAGLDVTAVRVSVDGRELADRLVGTALPVDIGEHVFTFEVSGQAPVSRTLVITEGEKGRRERIVIGGASAPPPAPAPSPGPAELPSAAPPASVPALPAPPPARLTSRGAAVGGAMGTQRILGLVGAGAGVVGVALGSVFGLMTISEKNQGLADCRSSGACNNHAQAVSDRSSELTDGAISTAAFVAGGVFLAGGAALFFTARPSSERAAAAILVVPSVRRGGGGISVRGEF